MSSNSNLLAVLGGEPVVERPLVEWPVVGEEDVAAVADVVRRGLFANEEEGARLPVSDYEDAFTMLQGARHAVAVTNGTHTLQLVNETLGIGLDDAVFVPGLTWQATPAAVADVNALPVLVDIDRGTWAMSPAALEAAIRQIKATRFKPRAVWVVHPYVRMADLGAIGAICEREGMLLLEDCAHAHGARWRGRGAGTIGMAGSFSFQRSKSNTTGEGGMVVTNDPYLAAALRSARNCGRAEPLPVEYESPLPSWAAEWLVPALEDATESALWVAVQSGNYRMTELQGALGIHQLARFAREQQPLRALVTRALERVADMHDGIRTLDPQPAVDAYPQYRGLVVEWLPERWDGMPAAAARAALEAELKVEVAAPYDSLNNSPYYRPHTKPARHRLNNLYWELLDPRRYVLPEAERAAENGLCFAHTFPLDRRSPRHLDAALTKLRSNLPEWRQWWEERQRG